MEYLPTNLPQYVRQTSRSALANSVVESGHVLLFSEDGESLTAKLPDGSFVDVGGGGATDFYKCASVDTVNQTWSGYKAVLSGGVYAFEATATAGLTYGGGFAPAAGNVYTADAMVCISALTVAAPSDYVIRHPLTASTATLPTGQTVTEHGTTFGQISGVPCMNSGYIDIPIGGALSSVFTASLKFSTSSAAKQYLLEFDSFSWGTNDGRINSDDGNPPLYTYVADGAWHSGVLVYDGYKTTMYIDGVLAGTDTPMYAPGFSGNVVVGAPSGGGNFVWSGGITDLMIFDRVLSNSEICALARA